MQALENIEEFPFLLEAIYRDALELDDEDLDRLRFGLVRLQVYADIHRYEDMEATQQMKLTWPPCSNEYSSAGSSSRARKWAASSSAVEPDVGEDIRHTCFLQ